MNDSHLRASIHFSFPLLLNEGVDVSPCARNTNAARQGNFYLNHLHLKSRRETRSSHTTL